MKSKNKYIAKALVVSMLLASPLAYAAEDDVVIFGGEFEDNVKAPDNKSTNNNAENDIDRETNTESEPEITIDSSDNSEFTNNPKDQSNNDETNNELYIEDNATNKDLNDDNDISKNIPIEQLDNSNESNDIDVDNNINEFDNENSDDIPYDSSNDINDISNEFYFNTDEYNEDINADFNDNFNINEQYPDVAKKSDLDEEHLYNNTNVKDTSKKSHKSSTKNQNNKQQPNKKARFIKLLSDDNYDYYLDREAVKWTYIPYSKTEYMADVWIRMIEKSPNNEDMPEDLYNYIHGSFDDEIEEARTKGIIYNEIDVRVLRTKKYFLEHYYIRPKTQQIQFLCELEVIGRPQNAVSERNYDYKNWESLIPGSIEFSIYHGVLSNIGTSKASNRGHMTFIDMIDEYARIALN